MLVSASNMYILFLMKTFNCTWKNILCFYMQGSYLGRQGASVSQIHSGQGGQIQAGSQPGYYPSTNPQLSQRIIHNPQASSQQPGRQPGYLRSIFDCYVFYLQTKVNALSEMKMCFCFTCNLVCDFYNMLIYALIWVL